MLRRSADHNYELGYTDEELEAIIIRLNNEAMNDLQIGNLKKVLAALTEANSMLDRMERYHLTKLKLKAFTLNGWACYYHQRRLNSDALKYIDEAITLEQEGLKDNVSLARSFLNKCVILSQMDQHDEALKFAHRAIECLQAEKKLVGVNRKRLQKLSELFVISFYNIAAEFEFMAQTDSATDAYKKGYDICRELLGEGHRLSQLMRRNLRQTRQKGERVNTIDGSNKSIQVANMHMNQRQHKKRLKTIEVQLYSSELQPVSTSTKRYARMHSTEKSSNGLTESKILERPENYLHMKNIKERISRIGNYRNNLEEEEDSFGVDRLKRIYMPDSYRKAKLRSRIAQKQRTQASPKESHKRHSVATVEDKKAQKSARKSSRAPTIANTSKELPNSDPPGGSHVIIRPKAQQPVVVPAPERGKISDPPHRESVELPTIKSQPQSTKQCRLI